jgi:hypothetical protein
LFGATFCGDARASSWAIDGLTWYDASWLEGSWQGIVVVSSC